MSRHKELIVLINLIYEAALDSNFWPSVLMALADAVGERAPLFDVVNGLASLPAQAGARDPAVPSGRKVH